MKYVLTDGSLHESLKPFTWTRAVSDLRVGILCIHEKWSKFTGITPEILTTEELQPLYTHPSLGEAVYIQAGILPNSSLVKALEGIQLGEVLVNDQGFVAYRSLRYEANDQLSTLKPVSYSGPIIRIERPWDLFLCNDEALRSDYQLLTSGRESAPLPPGNQYIGTDIFLEPGAQVYASVLNASTGPIYIGANSEVMEGCLVRGPFSLGAHSTLKMGAKIYGATTIGPHCKVGGEVSNSILWGYSNKAHDGFLGNSVLGAWCNLGADTNTSNLKNNYAPVKLWDYATERFAQTGLQFCGLMMGDHAKSAINTMFNTGTVVGVGAIIFGGGFVKNFVPGFSWGGVSGSTTFSWDRFVETTTAVYARRGMQPSPQEWTVLKSVFEATQVYRK